MDLVGGQPRDRAHHDRAALATGFPLNVEDWQGVLAIAAYAPLLAWGPLLGAVTVAYYRRRA